MHCFLSHRLFCFMFLELYRPGWKALITLLIHIIQSRFIGFTGLFRVSLSYPYPTPECPHPDPNPSPIWVGPGWVGLDPAQKPCLLSLQQPFFCCSCRFSVKTFSTKTWKVGGIRRVLGAIIKKYLSSSHGWSNWEINMMLDSIITDDTVWLLPW